MRRKHIYSLQHRITILGGIVLYLALIIWISIKFWENYVAVPEEHREWGIMLLPCLFLIVLVTFCWYGRSLIRKMLLCCTIDESGILCSGLTWKRFCLPWAQVQTYGVAQYSVSYQKMAVIYFWRHKEYVAQDADYIKCVNRVSPDHVALQAAPAFVEAIRQYAPREIAQNVTSVLEEGKSGHFHSRKKSVSP